MKERLSHKNFSERIGVTQNKAYIHAQMTMDIMVTANAAAPADGRRLQATPEMVNETAPDINRNSEYVEFTISLLSVASVALSVNGAKL